MAATLLSTWASVARIPLRSACPIRVSNGIFAAGDWPAKTGPEGDVSARRPEIGDHHTREMAAKTAFLLASYELRVSEDWVVAEAVGANHSPGPNSLLTGKITGNFAAFRLNAISQRQKTPAPQSLLSKIPIPTNREKV